MTILRILLAAALAATGHAGASVLIAALFFAARVLRDLLPAVPQITVAGLLVTGLLAGFLAVRAVWSWPYIMGVAQ